MVGRYGEGKGLAGSYMTHFYHLWLKECSDVHWTWFALQFLVASLPMVIKRMRESSIPVLLVYDGCVNLIIPPMVQPMGNLPTGNGSDNLTFAFFLAFGIGYSLLYFHKEKKTRRDKVLSMISLAVFSGLTLWVIVCNLKYF